MRIDAKTRIFEKYTSQLVYFTCVPRGRNQTSVWIKHIKDWFNYDE